MPDCTPSRVLLVKTSSMGDIVQALPVVHDILEHHAGCSIDWMLEPGYAELVQAHPGVSRVIQVPWRSWWRKPFATTTRGQWRELRGDLARHPYDVVIDLQGLCKSALLARLAQGRRYGWKGRACREPVAACLYDVRIAAPAFDSLVAVTRYRNLCASVLGYTPQGEPAYGLRVRPSRPTWLGGRQPFAVLLSAPARDEKLWPEASWVELGRQLRSRGLALALAWGSDAERERAARIAEGVRAAPAGAAPAPVEVAPQRLGLGEWAGVLRASALVVGVDTGLSFLAAAVAAPVIAIYAATSPAQVGIRARSPHRNLGDIGRPPSAAEVLQVALELLQAAPAPADGAGATRLGALA